MNTAAIYARVSTKDQNLDSQLQECRDWCQRTGIRATEYLDKASGSKVSRASLDELMADVRKGRVKTLVCHKLDRLGRSLVHLAQMIGEFDSQGIALVCPSQGIDTRASNPAGRLQMHVLMAIAEFERALIRERTSEGLAAAKSRGVKLGRPKGPAISVPMEDAKAQINAGKSIRSFAREHGINEATLRRRLRAG